MIEYLYVFDHLYSKLYEIELDEQDNDVSVTDVLSRRGFKETQCSYMFSEEKLNIETVCEK